MITSIFSKSKPANLIIVLLFVILVFVFTNIETFSFSSILLYCLRAVIAVFFVLLLDFIVQKNDLSKKNSYAIMFLALFYLAFPEMLKSTSIMLSVMFIVFALRRLLSLHTKRDIKKKYFDAAFWLTFATLCHSWGALFFVVHGIAIVYYWENNVKHMLVSVLGVLAAVVLIVLYNIIFKGTYFNVSIFNFETNFNFSYVNSASKIFGLGLIMITFIWSLVNYFKQMAEANKSSKPLFVIIVMSSFMGLLIGIIPSNKNGSELLFFAVPLSIIMANYLQDISSKWFRELFVVLFLAIPLLRLFL